MHSVLGLLPAFALLLASPSPVLTDLGPHPATLQSPGSHVEAPAPAGDTFGQDARISGVVAVRDTGLPVSGVTVTAGDGERRTTTNSLGSFHLTGVPVTGGEVELRFSRIGFREERIAVAVAEGETVRIEVTLVEEAVGLSPISVLLERTRMMGDPLRASGAPGSAFHISEVELQAQRLPFDNVHDLLRQVPGVNVQDEEGYGLRPNIGMRGAGAERSSKVTLMEDGVLIAPAPYSAPSAYYFPSMGRMEGVEVRKGASQIRYGPHTIGGAVNLLSSSIPDRRSWFAELAGGSESTVKGRVRVGDSSDHVGWLVEGYQLRTDGFKELQGGGQDTGFQTRDLMAKLRFNTNRDAPRYSEVEFKFGITDHLSDETYLGLTDADFRSTPNLRYVASAEDLMDADHSQLQARYFLQASPSIDVVVTAYRNGFSRNWYKLQSVMGRGLASVLRSPDDHASELAVLRGADAPDDALRVRANNRHYVSQGVQGVLGWRVEAGGADHQLELGVRYHRDHEDRLQWEDGYRVLNASLVRTSSGEPGSQANRLGEAEAWSVFLQDEIRAGRWAFVPGVRFEHVDFLRRDWAADDPTRGGESTRRANSVSVVIPGLGATYEVSPWTHLFAGVHRGFSPPGPGADQETRVEESVNYEAGVRVRRAGVGANVTGFFSDYSNVLGRATLASGEEGSGDVFNGGAVEVWGVEAAMEADLARYMDLPLSIPARGSYTFTRGVFQNSFESEYGPWGTVSAGDRLPYQPEHTWSGRLGVEDPGWNVALSWTGAGKMREEAGRGPFSSDGSIDNFLVFHLSGELEMSAGRSVFAAVQNLTDEKYVVSRRPAGARPGLPRSFSLGVRLRH